MKENANSIEDEKHFLTECKIFRNEREVLYKSAAEYCVLFTEMSDMNKPQAVGGGGCHFMLPFLHL